MKRLMLIILIFSGLAVTGCKRKSTSSKIMDNFPVNTLETVIPAKTAQEWFLLNRDLAGSLVNFLYRMQTYFPPTFPELTPPGGATSFNFVLSNSRYGNATMTIEFIANGTAVDPTIASSSMTVTQINVTNLSGNSSDFSYIETAPITLTIQTAGNLATLKSLVGAITFTGTGSSAGYSLVFTNDTTTVPGISCSTDGLIAGRVNATGTGPTGLSTSLSLSFDVKHNADGSIMWEGNQGEIHVNSTGSGLVITSQTRYPIN